MKLIETKSTLWGVITMGHRRLWWAALFCLIAAAIIGQAQGTSSPEDSSLDKTLESIAEHGEVYVLDKNANGELTAVKPPQPPKTSAFEMVKNFFKGEGKKDKDDCSGEKCQLDLYNFEPWSDQVSLKADMLDGLLSLECAVDFDGKPSAGCNLAGISANFDEEKVMVGGGIPGGVPVVKFSYEQIYSTADGKWVGKVIKGGLDFVFFSVEHVKVFMDGEEVKNFSKFKLLGFSYVETREKVGNKRIPVSKDVYFSISSPTPVVKVQVNKSITVMLSEAFENFGMDWCGSYEMDGNHRYMADILAGAEPLLTKTEKLKSFFGVPEKGVEAPKLLSMKKFDEMKGEWVTVVAKSVDAPVDPVSLITDKNMARTDTVRTNLQEAEAPKLLSMKKFDEIKGEWVTVVAKPIDPPVDPVSLITDQNMAKTSDEESSGEKSDDKKSDDKKSDDRQSDDKKSDDKQSDDKQSDDKQGDDKQGDDKQGDDAKQASDKEGGQTGAKLDGAAAEAGVDNKSNKSPAVKQEVNKAPRLRRTNAIRKRALQSGAALSPRAI